MSATIEVGTEVYFRADGGRYYRGRVNYVSVFGGKAVVEYRNGQTTDTFLGSMSNLSTTPCPVVNT